MIGYIEQRTGQPSQRPVDKAAQAKRKAAQEKRILAFQRQQDFEKKLAALRAKNGK